jgi:cystathionine beta-synthase
LKIRDGILDLIGRTPLVRLRTGIPDGVIAAVKLEFQNPTGSVKDRMAYYIVRQAINAGQLKVGDTIVDNTSGNTGASLAMVASVFGLKAILVAPDKTSQEKIDLIKSFGAEVIVTPAEAGHHDPAGCYMVARQLAKVNGYFDVDQYDNRDNVEAHYLSTGPEIWDDTDGGITHFVAGIGRLRWTPKVRFSPRIFGIDGKSKDTRTKWKASAPMSLPKLCTLSWLTR